MEPSPTPVVIDASTLPHIIESIVHHLCYDYPLAAISAARVCRDWNTRIYQHLFTHIRVDPVKAGRYGSDMAYTLRTRLPGANVRCTIYPTLCHAHIVKVPAGVSAALAKTRVLDLHADLGHLVVQALRLHMWRLHTVRIPTWRRQPAGPFDVARDLVIAHSGAEPHFGIEGWDRVKARNLDTLVAHFSEFTISISTLALAARVCWRLDSLVIFLPAPGVWRTGWRSRLYPSALCGLAKSLRQLRDLSEVIVVDPEPGCPSYSPDTERPTWKELESIDDKNSAEDAKVAFLTADEYRARVGEERYRVHALMKPL